MQLLSPFYKQQLPHLTTHPTPTIPQSFSSSPSSHPPIQAHFNKDMVSLETIHASTKSIDQTSSPRISFSSEFLDESNFISITPNPIERDEDKEKEKARNNEFEFLSSEINTQANMITADELFFEGKLLPYWQVQLTEKLNQMSLKSIEKVGQKEEDGVKTKEEPRVSWFIDDDPSPRPPKCTVLWKELLRLKKQKASSLSPSSSSSSTSSSSSSMGDIVTNEGKEGSRKGVKRVKKGMERSRSASFRIRPMVNVPICKQVKSSGIPSMFSIKKGRSER